MRIVLDAIPFVVAGVFWALAIRVSWKGGAECADAARAEQSEPIDVETGSEPTADPTEV